MPNGPVSTCIVGLGWWGGEHAKAARRVENLRVTACFARDSGKRAAFAREHGCRTMESWEAVLRDSGIEALILATPHSTHARFVEEAASAGKHVLVEKPFVLHVPDGQRAIAACERAGVRLAVGHQRRCQPAHRELKRLIESGKLGQIVQIEGNFSYDFGFRLDLASWRADPAESPAGSMTGLGIHHADTLQYLLEPVKRLSALSRSVHPRTPLDDVTGVLLEFESGPVGYLGTNMLTPKVFYIRLHGTGGNAWAESEGTILTLHLKDAKEPEVTRYPVEGDPVTHPLAEGQAEFAAAIRENRAPEVDGAAGLRASAILEGITVSARENRTIDLAELYE
ncbi:MAG: Gfo/Idh/MocA family oxidoreductase [Candidatus Tectomicrobia bacterium]|uniref:Gfo/Idh/MocA family oxidoreductase n=1 Tax=Tectimicrobiota bacterium TaxID=2528274 RepID=A0A932MS19_UNCTE|nr:Gfo/Idh/MocA family oxidoreductase [Candidatus Tectomicrobia bacterium]